MLDGHKAPNDPLIEKCVNKLEENNSRATSELLNGMCKSIYTKFMHFDSARTSRSS